LLGHPLPGDFHGECVGELRLRPLLLPTNRARVRGLHLRRPLPRPTAGPGPAVRASPLAGAFGNGSRGLPLDNDSEMSTSLHRLLSGTKFAMKLAASRFITYRQGPKPNIVISAHGRGGSTLLSDMLTAERGMWTYFEPFYVAENCPTFP